MTEQHSFEFKATAVQEAGNGSLSGYANVHSVVDDGGDRVLPGAFSKDVLGRFLKEGAVTWAHDWKEIVAMPTVAFEDDRGLFLEAEFHGTPRAQEARRIVSERIKSGRPGFGLSIGYEVDRVRPAAHGRDILSFKRLFEVALTLVPMNALSTVTGVKGSAGVVHRPDCPKAARRDRDQVFYVEQVRTARAVVSRALDLLRADPSPVVRSTAEDTARKAAAELGIAPPRIVWSKVMDTFGRDGQCGSPDVIQVRPGLTPEQIVTVVAHEVHHASEYAKGSFALDRDPDPYWQSVARARTGFLEAKAQYFAEDFARRWRPN